MVRIRHTPTLDKDEEILLRITSNLVTLRKAFKSTVTKWIMDHTKFRLITFPKLSLVYEVDL